MAASEHSGAPPCVWVGACAVDVATGQMLLGQWLDDEMRSQVGANRGSRQRGPSLLPRRRAAGDRPGDGWLDGLAPAGTLQGRSRATGLRRRYRTAPGQNLPPAGPLLLSLAARFPPFTPVLPSPSPSGPPPPAARRADGGAAGRAGAAARRGVGRDA